MISVFEPRLSLNDKYSVVKTLYQNQISGTSPIVEKFEKSCSQKFDREHAIAVSNGSVALDLAFQLIDLSEGDEVIIPSFTIISCLSAIIRAKAVPVFCDVDENSWNMTLEKVREKTTNKTKAVLLVHLYGLAGEAEEISTYCIENNIFLIEDAAEAHGQKIGNKKCGSFGLISTMSFYANKHITTGEGGMLLTDDDGIKEKAQLMRNLGFKSEKRFQHNEFYWNYRMGGLQAALGVSQLKSLEKTINKKIDQGNYYQNNLDNMKEKIQLPLKKDNETLNHYWVFGLVLRKFDIREEVMSKLFEAGVQTRPFFWPLHLQEVLKKINLEKQPSLPVSERIGKNGFYIPIGDHLSKKDQDYIIKNLVRILDEHL
jgi:perosamine synthetase